MFLKQLLLGLGLCAGLAVAFDDSLSPLTINNAEYEKRCGAGSDPHYPCFTFLAGDLKDVHVQSFKDEFSFPPTDFLVKDDQMRDFTLDDAGKTFSIFWREFRTRLVYTPVDTSAGRYNILVEAIGDNNARIWVNDGQLGEDIDLDSAAPGANNRNFNSKWLRIHVANDRGQN